MTPRLDVRTVGDAARGLVRARPEVAVAAAFLLGVLVRTWPVPIGIQVLGVLGGGALALHALGITLVYRANRILNFAQLSMGGLAGLMFVQLVERRTFISGLRTLCEPCVGAPSFINTVDLEALDEAITRDPVLNGVIDRTAPLSAQREAVADILAVGTAPGWMVQVNYWLSAVLSLVVAVFVVWAFYHLVIKRFNDAPRLVLTVITVAAGFAIDTIASFILGTFFGGTAPRYTRGASPPLDWAITIGPARLHAAELLTGVVVALALGAVVLVFRRTALGIALRGSAENAERARTLGIPVESVTGRAWALAGMLAALASLLSVMAGTGFAGGSMGPTVRMLAAAAIGALVSLPATLFGAIAIGLMDQGFIWDAGTNDVMVLVLLALIVAVLLVQRHRMSRAEVEAQATWEASREMRPIPPELRGVTAVRRTLVLLAVLLVVWVLGYPWVMSPSQTNLAISTMALGMVGLSLLVLTGWAGQISLGQMGFAAVGGWVALVSGLPILVALIAGGVVAGACALVVGIPVLRLRGLHVAITTLAFGLAVTSVLLDKTRLGARVPTTVNRPVLLGLALEDTRVFYYFTLVILALVVVGTAGMRRSRTARVLIASKDNEQAAETFGISVRAARLRAFAISGFMAGVAGATLAYAQHALDPSSFSPGRSLDVFLVTLIGGMGSLAGPLLGAAYRGIVQMTSTSSLASYVSVFLDPGLGVLIVFLVVPGGLTQLVFAVRDAWLRRLASRLRIVVPSLISDRREGKNERLPMEPKLWPSSTLPMFVPERYRLEGQWARTARVRERERVLANEEASRA